MVRAATKVDYHSIGAVEGRLELVSLHPGRRHFKVCRALDSRRVKCSLPPELEAEVKDSLGKRVIVSGLISYAEKGKPLYVQSQRLRILPEDWELPSIADMLGMAPDITGDLTTEEYIRRLRDG